MKRFTRVFSWSIAFACLLDLPATAGAGERQSLVRKLAENFDDVPWPVDGWNRATGTTSCVADVPAGSSGKCLQAEVRFSGKGFEWFGAGPAAALVIPGDAKTLTLQYWLSDKRYPLLLKFKDGWGRSEPDGKKLEWALPATIEGQWASATFNVPGDWVRPVSLIGLATHNWSAQSEAKTVRFRLDQCEVETDVADIDPKTGILKTWRPEPQPKDPATALAHAPRSPLVDVACFTGLPSNVFSATQPAVTLRIRNWMPQSLRGTCKISVSDGAGRLCDKHEHAISVDSIASVQLPLKVERFGLYTVAADAELSDGTKRTSKIVLAKLPPSRPLSPAEKRASPYGINVNGGRETFAIEAFREAGVVWFRDYAFSYEWLLRAKGDDHRYSGWPSYPKLLERYRQAGAMVLPCLMKSIQPPESRNGKQGRVGPNREWIRNIADVLNAFPELTHWELDNEYDLAKDNADAEAAVDWRNYRAYHRRLAEIAELLGAGEVVAVEQGPAGIYPDRIAQSIRSGDFDKVGVVNSHYYCGTEAPEVNVGNWNTDAAGDFRRQPPMLLFDRLRAAKRAAVADGRPRESWLTEFGWDTLAGPRVTAEQQAVYLARGWLLALAAGTDKCFWFYDYDASAPKQFFDGCGLLAADGSPKLSLCALAGLSSLLPNPKYVGSINAGRGTCGFVFTDGDQLVAAMWSIQETRGPSVTFRARELRDYLGNRLDGLTTQLSVAPVYAVGLNADDPCYRQTAYEQSTPHLVVATAGDTVESVVEVRNNRPQSIACTLQVTPPGGWTAPQAAPSLSVAKGQMHTVPIRLAVPPNEPMGMKEAMLTITEHGPQASLATTVKQIPLAILVQPSLFLEVGPLRGKPGPATVAVKVGNRSAKPLDGTLRLLLPKSWRAAGPEIAVLDLKPEEVRELNCELTWNTDWRPEEAAIIEFDGGGGRAIRGNIVPGRFRMHRVKDIAIDGREDDWPAETQLPDWLFNAAGGRSAARLRLAWGSDGLYGFVDVPEADVENPDPRSFWTCTCLELFVDSRDDKHDRGYAPGDHQFWLVPQVAAGRVYAGQWKRGDETPATRYDLRAIEGVSLAKGRGFVMEFRIPASELKSFQAASGRSIGLNLNLTIKGQQGMREVYWPAAKNSGALNRPGTWGSMELVP